MPINNVWVNKQGQLCSQYFDGDKCTITVHIDECTIQVQHLKLTDGKWQIIRTDYFKSL